MQPIRTIFFACLLFLSLSAFAQSYEPDTTSLTLAQFKEQALEAKDEVWVIDLWASWCGPCRESIPMMKEIHENLADEPVRFVSFSFDRRKDAWLGALMQYQMPWNHFFIPKRDKFVDGNFPAAFIPTIYIIDREGEAEKVKFRHHEKLEKLIRKKLK